MPVEQQLDQILESINRVETRINDLTMRVQNVESTLTSWQTDELQLQRLVVNGTVLEDALAELREAVSSAQQQADTAVSKAAAAQSTANTAVGEARNAQSTADTGIAKANSAHTRADTILNKAEAAQRTANSAVSIASTKADKRIESNGEADVHYLSTTTGIEWEVGTGYNGAEGGASSFFWYASGEPRMALTKSGDLHIGGKLFVDGREVRFTRVRIRGDFISGWGPWE